MSDPFQGFYVGHVPIHQNAIIFRSQPHRRATRADIGVKNAELIAVFVSESWLIRATTPARRPTIAKRVA